jgi:GAF domain-containing protein
MDIGRAFESGRQTPLHRRPRRPRDMRLARISVRLADTCSLPEIMQIVTHAARVLIACDGVTLILRDGDLCHYAEEDAISPLWKGRRFSMTACISGWCMLERRCASIPDIYADDRIPHDAYRPTFVKSLIMVPIGAPEPLAAMGAYWASKYQATSEDIEFLQLLADVASPSLAAVDSGGPALSESGS